MEEKFKKLYHEMRASGLGKRYINKNVVDVSQPGYWISNPKILYIGINPSIPKPTLIPTDAKLLEKDISDDEFMSNYLISQKSWYFYKNFIKEFTPDEKDFSILNVCFYPTNNNVEPPQELVEECAIYILQAIELINPKNIIVLGKIAKIQMMIFKSFKELNKDYNIIYSHHYAYYLRNPGEWEEQKKIILEELK